MNSRQALLMKMRAKKTLNIIAVAVVFGCIGLYMLLMTRAATPTASLEAESAILAGSAVITSDATASGGRALKFNNATTTTPPSTGVTIVDTNFEALTAASPMLLSDYRTAMGDAALAVSNSNLVNTSVVNEGGTHGKFIRQKLLASDGTQENVGKYLGGDSGIVTFPKLAKTVDEASIQYDIRFADNTDGTTFEWKGGGKLPGLGGLVAGATVDGVTVRAGAATGCTSNTSPSLQYVWSGRGMWIGPPAYSVTTGLGNEFIGYMYNYNKKENCGDNVRTAKGFKTNTWHTIKQYYKMNTFNTDGTPKADGVHRMWLDGVLIKDTNNFLFRKDKDLHISHMYWAIFRGGSEASPVGTWDSQRIGLIDIDNLKVTTP